MYSSRYRFYSNGNFALADAHYRTIWFVLNDHVMAQAIRRAFVSKLTLLTFDLTVFKNFDADNNTVDSDVCLDWQVSPTQIERLITPELTSWEFDQIQTTYSHDPVLINQPAQTLLTRDQQLELQDQIFLYHRVRRGLKFNHFEPSYFRPGEEHTQILFDQIDQIFMVELDLHTIEHNLYALALDNFQKHPWESAHLIQILGRNLYE